MKLSLVTETFPPEINGVAMTLHRLVHALALRGHTVEVVRPRQFKSDGMDANPYAELLVPGLPCPGYADLKIGLPLPLELDTLRFVEDYGLATPRSAAPPSPLPGTAKRNWPRRREKSAGRKLWVASCAAGSNVGHTPFLPHVRRAC